MKIGQNLLDKIAYFPLVIGLTVSGVTLVISALLSHQNNRQIEQIILTETAAVKNEIIGQLERRIMSLERMAKRWEVRGGTPRLEWEADAQNYVSHQEGYQSIQWVDSDYQVRWVVPQKVNETVINLDLGLESRRLEALEAARNRREVTITRPLDLVQGGKGFLAYFPLFLGSEFDGFILGVFQIQPLLDEIFAQETHQKYGITILDEEVVIYNTIDSNWELEQWIQSTTVELYGVKWQMKLAPSAELLASVQSPLPDVVRTAGLILGWSLAAVVYLAQTTLEAKQLLQLAKTELEEKVIERTAELSHAKEVAEAANQAKDNFISHMNHELRTPLNGILGFTQILQKDPHLNNQQNQNLSLIHQSGRHLLDLINDLLNFSKIEADKIQLEEQDFNLPDFLDNLVALSHLRAEQKNIDFHYRFSSSLPQVVKADDTRLRQVLLNLLSNAIKFTERGEVTFQVGYVEDFELEAKKDRGDGEDREDEGEIFPTSIHYQLSTINHHKIRFQIKDTGIGIPEHKLADIFLPFEQVHEAQLAQEGTGLGLTISQKLIQLMGSQIQVDSTVGEGSSFWFDLDLFEGDPANVFTTNVQSEIQPTGFSGQTRKVLIVDDLADNRQLLVQYLQPLGFELAEAENGRQGLTLTATFQPDVILLDALMPEINGLEMLQQLRQHPQLQDTKVIFVSANSQFREQLQTSQLQFEDFLDKPVDFSQLLQSLQTHLHLQWLFPEREPESNSASLIPPPPEQLLNLWELAQMGDMGELETQINSLEQSDAQYLPFVHKVRPWVESFNQNQLIKFLEYVRDNP